jgi:hypothetical protein
VAHHLSRGGCTRLDRCAGSAAERRETRAGSAIGDRDHLDHASGFQHVPPDADLLRRAPGELRDQVVGSGRVAGQLSHGSGSCSGVD